MGDPWRNTKEVYIPDEVLLQTLENEDNSSFSDKLYRGVKRQPFLIAGLVGFAAVSGIGIYKWKRRTIPAAMFIVQLRVAAQGTALACLTMGMIHQMYQTLTKHREQTENTK
ncbi:HIG1 domain family member 1A, mitochondrial-like [Augochlora pura]